MENFVENLTYDKIEKWRLYIEYLFIKEYLMVYERNRYQ